MFLSFFLQFQAYVEKQFNFTIKSFNSNWGGKFRPLFKHFQQTGIQHRITYPHTHVQNGTAERETHALPAVLRH